MTALFDYVSYLNQLFQMSLTNTSLLTAYYFNAFLLIERKLYIPSQDSRLVLWHFEIELVFSRQYLINKPCFKGTFKVFYLKGGIGWNFRNWSRLMSNLYIKLCPNYTKTHKCMTSYSSWGCPWNKKIWIFTKKLFLNKNF